MIRTGYRLFVHKKVPVYTSEVTGKQYIKTLDIPTGRFQFVELDGALTFRKDTSRSYPLPPEMDKLLENFFFDADIAFEHRDEEERRKITLTLLKTAFEFIGS